VDVMRQVLSIFQTAEGGPHWISILTVAGWLVTGFFIFTSLVLNRNDRIKQGPWQFSGSQQTKFVELLSGAVKGKIALEYSKADEKRAHDFAVKLKAIFEAAGYDVWGYMPAFIQSSGEPITGVQIQVVKGQPSDEVGSYIQKAFQNIGFEAPGVTRNNNNYPDDTALILVGIKP
jgi:hypothetical protein